MKRPAARAISSGIVTLQAGEAVIIMAESHSEDQETERRRDEALRRALAMPPMAKAKRHYGQAHQAIANIIIEAGEIRAEIATLRRDAFRPEQGGRSKP